MFKCKCDNCGDLELAFCLHNCPYCGSKLFIEPVKEYRKGYKKGYYIGYNEGYRDSKNTFRSW